MRGIRGRLPHGPKSCMAAIPEQVERWKETERRSKTTFSTLTRWEDGLTWALKKSRECGLALSKEMAEESQQFLWKPRKILDEQ